MAFRDSTVNSHHSSVINGIFIKDGNRLGLLYDDTTEASQVPNSNDFKPDTLHVTTWVKPDDIGGSGRSAIIGPPNSDSSGTFVWAIRYTSDGYLGFSATDSNFSWFDITTTEVLPLNVWSKIDMIIDAGNGYTASLYFNNSLISSSSNLGAGLNQTHTFPLLFAGHLPAHNADRKFPGIIGETRISDAVRSSAWMAVDDEAMNDTLLVFGEEQGNEPVYAEYTAQLLRRIYQAHSSISPVVRHLAEDQSYHAQIVRHLSAFQEYIAQTVRRVYKVIVPSDILKGAFKIKLRKRNKTTTTFVLRKDVNSKFNNN